MMLLEEAYRGRPSAPNFDGSEHFLGLTEAVDGTLIDPELKKHAVARRKDDMDIKREERKFMEESRLRIDPKGKGKGTPDVKPG